MGFFLISCGGTGGHLSPGIALAEGLAARGHGARLLISQKKVDARLSEKYPALQFVRTPGTGFSWHPLRCARFLASQWAGFRFCRALVRERRPDAVVAFGGFTSAPLVLAARLGGVPVALHESNRVPGRAVRLLGRLATRVYLPPGVLLPSVRPSATRHAGQPVRQEIARLGVSEAREALGLDENNKILVVLGGSQGASPLNDWVRANLGKLAAEGIQVYCITGIGKGREGLVDLPLTNGGFLRAQFVPFSDRMAEVLSAADLVLSRAGAGTLAELIRCEAPAILVPFPQAMDDHQRANAEFFERQGGGLVVPQAKLGTLLDEVRAVIYNDWLLRKFRGNLRRMDRANALELMVDDLEEIAARPVAPPPETPAPQPA